MTDLAFQSDELDLTDAEKAQARHEYAQFGPVSADTLCCLLRDAGYRRDGVMESALLLPLEDYRVVEELYKSLPDNPPRRR
jgi:hypothetical protein